MSTVYLDPTYALLTEDWANINVHRIHSAALRNLISAHQAVFRIFEYIANVIILVDRYQTVVHTRYRG